MHQKVGNVLRILIYSNPPKNMTQAKDIVDDALATAMYAMRTVISIRKHPWCSGIYQRHGITPTLNSGLENNNPGTQEER